MKVESKIIVALDNPDPLAIERLVEVLSPSLCRLKIGNILFTRHGPVLVEKLARLGFEIFLDLKFHDIPQTVAGACRQAAELGVWMVNVHVTSGSAALKAAREALEPYKQRPLLMGVTALTSLEQADFSALFGMDIAMPDVVLRLARLAQQHGLDGVVCSAQEVSLLRSTLGPDFVLVTPGIRLADAPADDQKRTMTPAEALQAGADYLVIGRPITAASHPVQALKEIIGACRSVDMS